MGGPPSIKGLLLVSGASILHDVSTNGGSANTGAVGGPAAASGEFGMASSSDASSGCWATGADQGCDGYGDQISDGYSAPIGLLPISAPASARVAASAAQVGRFVSKRRGNINMKRSWTRAPWPRRPGMGIPA